MQTCAVVMAAYRATSWILQALDSIDAQRSHGGWQYEVRIGVDGCEQTSRLLLDAGRAHWFSHENVGPYVIRNSLIRISPASAYAIFDADDVMRPEYLRTLLGCVGESGIAGAARWQVDAFGTPLNDRPSPFRGGVAVVSHSAWSRLGGYRAWRIAADNDLIVRARAMKIPVRTVTSALYDRRVHEDSLTRRPETGFGSQPRKELKRAAQQLIKGGCDLCVAPVTVPLEYRQP